MKKIKVILAAFAVVAVVSGALAFKASKNTQFCAYTTTEFADGACAIVIPNATLTTVNPGSATAFPATVKAKVAGQCPQLSTAECVTPAKYVVAE